MKTFRTVLKISILSCILLIAIQGSSAGKIHVKKGNACKKPVTASKIQKPPEFPSVIERLLNNIEKNIVSTAEAMPEDKFYFTPESLDIKGSEFKGVRTFAAQIKHLATDNFAIWSPITGDPLRADITDVNGPENIKTKAEIIQFLKESFALGHKAIATLTEKNATEMLSFRGGSLPRLDLAFYALTHANEHYGQMVVYLRMCGIISSGQLARETISSGQWSMVNLLITLQCNNILNDLLSIQRTPAFAALINKLYLHTCQISLQSILKFRK